MDKKTKLKIRLLTRIADCELSDIEFVPYESNTFRVPSPYDEDEEIQYLILTDEELADELCDKVRDKIRYGSSYEDVFEDLEDWIKDHADETPFDAMRWGVAADYVNTMSMEEFINACISYDLANEDDFTQGDIMFDKLADKLVEAIADIYSSNSIDWYMGYMGYTISEMIANKEIEVDADDLAYQLANYVYANRDLICNLLDYSRVEGHSDDNNNYYWFFER